MDRKQTAMPPRTMEVVQGTMSTEKCSKKNSLGNMTVLSMMRPCPGTDTQNLELCRNLKRNGMLAKQFGEYSFQVVFFQLTHISKDGLQSVLGRHNLH